MLAMAHMMKVKGSKSQIYGLMKIHNDRGKEDPDNERDRGNSNIDPERSHLNYELMGRDDPYKYASERLDQLEKEQKEQTGRGFRSDAIKACSLVVYLPKELEGKGEEYEKQFFQGCTDYAIAKFGKENVLQAMVHKDENRPHIHIVSLPITRDKETDREKLCYKEAFTKADYKKMHPELERHTQERTNDKSIRLYDPLAEKKITVSKERYALNDEIKKLDIVKEELERKEKELSERAERLKQQEERAQKQLQEARDKLNKEIKAHNERVKEFNEKQQKLERAKELQSQQVERTQYFKEKDAFCRNLGINEYTYEKAVRDYERSGDPTFNFFDKDGKQYNAFIEPEMKNPDREDREKQLLQRECNNYYADRDIHALQDKDITRLETPQEEKGQRSLDDTIERAERQQERDR